MVEAASSIVAMGEEDKELFPERFFDPDSFVAPTFSSVIDRYYHRFYKHVDENTMARMIPKNTR